VKDSLPTEIVRPRHHVVITGSGRAGTTFLVELLFHLGLNTGYQADSIEQYKYPNARAGLEVDIRELPCPYIVKSPWFCNYADDVFHRKDIVVDHIFVPMRDLYAAAESRRYVSRSSQSGVSLMDYVRCLFLPKYWFNPKQHPGGLFGTKSGKPGAQEEVLLMNLYKLMLAVSGSEVPITLLRFPLLTRDSEYLFHKLSPVLGEMDYVQFQDVFRRVVRPDLVHRFGDHDN
jgi:hypothetical protein